MLGDVPVSTRKSPRAGPPTVAAPPPARPRRIRIARRPAGTASSRSARRATSPSPSACAAPVRARATTATPARTIACCRRAPARRRACTCRSLPPSRATAAARPAPRFWSTPTACRPVATGWSSRRSRLATRQSTARARPAVPTAGSCATVELRGNAATCSAACVVTPITTCVTGDRGCPPGCTAATDADCPRTVCGDGVVEIGEACNRGITAGLPGACAGSCNDGDACTVDVAAGIGGLLHADVHPRRHHRLLRRRRLLPVGLQRRHRRRLRGDLQ